MTIERRKRLQDGTLGDLEKVFEGETDKEKIKRLEGESENLQELDFNIMLASTEMYEEMTENNLNLMMAITELYEQVVPDEGVE